MTTSNNIQHTANRSAIVPSRFEDFGAMTLAGIMQRYNCENTDGIPKQWGRFAPHIGNVPNQIGRIAYGVVTGATDTTGRSEFD